MLRRLSVRGKVLAVLAVPVLVLFVAAGFISTQSIAEVRTARAVNDVLEAISAHGTLIEHLQAEREATLLHMADVRLAAQIASGEKSESAERREERLTRSQERAEAIMLARTATDASLTRVSNSYSGIGFELLPAPIGEGVNAVLQGHADLAAARERADSGTVVPSLVAADFATLLRRDVGLSKVVAANLDNRAVGAYLDAFGQVTLTSERVLEEGAVGRVAVESDGTDLAANLYVSRQIPNTTFIQQQARTAVTDVSGGEILMPDFGASAGYGGASFQASRVRMEENTPAAFTNQLTDQFIDFSKAEAEALNPTITALWDTADTAASAAESSALRGATLTILAAAAAVAASIFVALLISRAITVPLRRLTVAAGEVRDQLPKLVEQVSVPGQGPDLSLVQIPVNSSDEVGQLATVFNEVNQTTVEVAQEQAALRGSIAEMFVNVARRDQVLLNRQLSFIDTLERTEEDPNTLANLFRLDHLATRMRRNAESLLVLAGIDSGRRVRDSMTFSDVIRTASSEIEQYDRLQLTLGVDPHMHGFNSLPAAHLLAEVLENAAVFSEPETPVEVITGSEIEFISVAIIDHGLGMTEEEMKAANLRIRSTSATEVIGAQRLGLHVVGRLATRLGTKVELSKSPYGAGTQTLVRFPRALFVDGAESVDIVPIDISSAPVMPVTQVHEVEAPVVAPVDIAALTDGETELGLPKRRAAEPEAPQTPAPALPARRNIVLPPTATPTLTPEVAAANANAWAPDAVQASAESGLPSRTAGTTAGALSVDGQAPSRRGESIDPLRRTSVFAGFRRGADLQPGVDEAPEAEDEFVVPGLAPDEDEVRAQAETVADQVDEQVTLDVPGLEPDVVVVDDAQSVAEVAVEPQPAAVEAFEALSPSADAEPSFGTFSPANGYAAESNGHAAAPVADAPQLDESRAWFGGEEPTPQVAEPVAPAAGWTASEAATHTWSPADDGGADVATEAAVFAPEPAAFSPEPAAFVPEPAAFVPEPAAFVPEPAAFVPEPAAFVPEPAAFVPEPAAFVPEPAPSAPSPATPATPALSSIAPLPAFADVVGETPTTEKKKRGSLFSRKPKATAAPALPTPAQRRKEAAAAAKAAKKAERAAQKSGATDARAAKKADQAEARSAKKSGATAAPASAGFQSQPVPVAAVRGGSTPSAHSAPTPAWTPPAELAAVVPTPATPVSEQAAPVGAWASSSVAESTASPSAPSVPSPTFGSFAPAPQAYSAPSAPAPQAFVAPPPAPQAYAAPPVAPGPVAPAAPAPAPAAPAVSSGGPAPTPGTQFSPAPAGAWTPQGSDGAGGRTFGALDDEVAAMLALRSDIQEQALAELSQLSTYRPQAVKGTASLTRRTPTAIPSAPEMDGAESGQPIQRDADQLRSRLSSFQSGASRGRSGQHTTDSAPSTDVGAAPSANGAMSHHEAGATPSEPAPQEPTW